MSQLMFSNEDEFTTITKKIEYIMTSYGRNRGIWLHPDNYAELFCTLLYLNEIAVYENNYTYDFNIKKDTEVMEKYMALLPKTRWRSDTKIETVRLNAIKVFNDSGNSDCVDSHIIYPESKAIVHCGDMELYKFFNMYRDNEMHLYTTFNIFSNPLIQEEETNARYYYSFVLSSTAIEIIKKFLDGEWERVVQGMSDMYNKETRGRS